VPSDGCTHQTGSITISPQHARYRTCPSTAPISSNVVMKKAHAQILESKKRTRT
jgi:hypothetical protein